MNRILLMDRWINQLSQRSNQGDYFPARLVGLCLVLLMLTAGQMAQAQTLSLTITPQSVTYSEGQSVTITFSGGTSGESYLLSMYDIDPNDLNNSPIDFSEDISIIPYSSNTAGSGNTVTWTGTQSSYFVVTFNNGSAGSPRIFDLLNNEPDFNDYGDSQSFTIVAANAPCTPPSVSITAIPSLTVGSGGSVTLTASGADSYIWSANAGGVTSTSVVVNAAGIYSVTGTTSGCSATASAAVSVTQPPSLTLVVSNYTSIACTGNFIDLSVSVLGGTTPYTYAWLAPANVTFNSPDNSSAVQAVATTTGLKTFTVTVSSSGGSPSSTTTVDVLVNQTPTSLSITVTPSNTIVPGQSVTLTASGAASYTWNNGETTVSLIVSPTYTNDYSVNGTSAEGCKYNSLVSVYLLNCQTTLTSSASSVCVGGAVSLTATTLEQFDSGSRVAIAPASYTWVAPAGAGFSTPTTDGVVSATFTASGVKTFTAIVRSPGGCLSSQTVSVTVNSPTVSINPATTTIAGGQAVTLTASGAASYTWSTGSNLTAISVSPTNTTVYSVTGSSNGCVGQATATVSGSCDPSIVADAISTTVTQTLGPNNCSVTLTGTGYGTGYQLTGPGGFVFSAVYRRVGYYTIKGVDVKQPGTYTLIVTYSDACGRVSSDTMTYVVTGTACK